MAHHPLILIHGLGGHPEDWEKTGIISFLVEQGGYDRNLIRSFDYGSIVEGNETHYNYQGDIQQIAHRLCDDPNIPDAFPFQVDRLSRESVAQGGPEKVDIVTFSMGGLIARYYLAQREEDSWGTRYTGKVRKLIQLSSPNLGVDWIALYNNHLHGSFIWRLVVKLSQWGVIPVDLASDVERTHVKLRAMKASAAGQVLSGDSQPIQADSVAAQQLAPDSALLTNLNRPNQSPTDVSYACIYGDLVAALRLHFAGLNLNTEFSMGDLIVSTKSASTIPGIRPTERPFRRRYELTLGEPERRAELMGRELVTPPPYSHIHLNDQPDVQAEVLRLLQS